MSCTGSLVERDATIHTLETLLTGKPEKSIQCSIGPQYAFLIVFILSISYAIFCQWRDFRHINICNRFTKWRNPMNEEQVMWQRTHIILIVLAALSFWAFSCAHVNYIGKSFEPTSDVDVYFSKEEIEREYVIIGHAIGSGQLFVSNDKIGRKLREKAMANGADAILITGVGRDNAPTGDGSVTEKQIQASFLKYKLR